LALPAFAALTYSPGVTICTSHPCTIAVTCPTSQCTASDIQAAINEAHLGDTITIQAGVTWTVNTPLILYRKTSGSGQLTIRASSADAVLPAAGVRVTPAYKPLLANLQLTSPYYDELTVEQTSNAVENYTFIGVWFSTLPGLDSTSTLVDLWVPQSNDTHVTSASNTTPVTLTMGSTTGFSNGNHVIVSGDTGNTGADGWWTITNVTGSTMDLVGSIGSGTSAGYITVQTNTQWDASQTPNNIVFDRCMFVGNPLSAVRQGVRIAGRNVTVENSYFDQIKNQGDSQSISMPSTPGPVTITNNYLGGGPGETVVTGGVIPNLAGPSGTGQDATNITLTHNAIYKDPALYKYDTWTASTWVRQGKIINGGNGYNYIAITSGMTGLAAPTFPTSLCANPLIPSGGCSATDGGVTWERNWFVNSDRWGTKNLVEFKTASGATIRWNTMDGSWQDGQAGQVLVAGIGRQGYIGLPHCEGIEFGDNVARNYFTFIAISSAGDYGATVTDTINIHDNLAELGNPLYGTDTSSRTLSFGAGATAPPYFTSLILNHNTIESNIGAHQYWFMNSPTSGSFTNPVVENNIFHMGLANALYTLCPGYYTGKAALDCLSTGGVGAYTFGSNVLGDESSLSPWPSGNFNPAWSSIAFTNPTNQNYTLLSSSPYHNAGTDGKDLGADTTQLPLITGLTVTPTADMARLSWSTTAPLSAIPCVIEASTNRDLSITIPDLDPTLYTRPGSDGLTRTLTLGANAALSPASTYWYRLHCGGAFEQGSFTTQAISPRGVFGRGTVTGRGVVR
jgi:hypothetical protein